ncbi:DUF6231 family protein [Algiphilus sp.]|uniref:DUF6231 family protein n=1 Tax=Algiphilus sp. TaxID=1872431 RepID=UPI003B52B335
MSTPENRAERPNSLREAITRQCIDPVVLLHPSGMTVSEAFPGESRQHQSTDEIAKALEPPRAGLAILTAEWLRMAAEEDRLERELAALRDLYAQAVLAVADSACPLAPAQWRSLGFLPHWHDEEAGLTLQGFNLYDYKHRPDWLNAKHWANPELWDVYRW